MTKKEEEIAYEIIKLTVIAALLLTVALVIVARWICQASVRFSLAAAQRFGPKEGATDRQAGWASLAWFALFAVPALATGDPVIALVGIAFGFVVARLVWLELTGTRDLLNAARIPGSLILGGIKDTWWGGVRPYILDVETRCQHTVISGATGSGKTAAGTHFIAQDIWNNAAVVLVDPKSDYSNSVMSLVPDHRLADVVLLDPSDSQPVGINPFRVPEHQHTLAAGELLSVFATFFADSWSARQAHLMKMAILLALSIERSTLLDLPRIFTDSSWRKQAAFRCPNTAVRQFWLVEFDALWAAKDLSPILYKLGSFTTAPELRRLFGQTEPRISFDDIVNTEKILIVRVPSGVLSPEIARFLSSLVVKQVQLACHRRVQHDGPRPFVGLWIDEAANYVESDSLLTLVSESRSMRLGAALLTQTTRTFSRELQISLDVNIATQMTALKIGNEHWLDVQRLHEPEPIRFPHPGPLAPVSRERIERIRASSRELYGARSTPHLQAVPALLDQESEELRPAAGGENASPPRRRQAPITTIGGQDVDEED